MGSEDRESQVVVSEFGHEFETYFDLIKLSLPIPKEEFAPQFIFTCPDENALFKILHINEGVF